MPQFLFHSLKFLSFIIVISIILTGCGSVQQIFSYRNVAPEQHIGNYREIPIYIDGNFTDKEKDELLQAIGEWNWVLNNYIKLTVQTLSFNRSNKNVKNILEKLDDSELGYLIIKLNHDDPMIEDVVKANDGTLAFVNGIGEGHLMVVVGDRISLRNFKLIVLHELGHLLGARHVNAKSLMYPQYGAGYGCIDKITTAQVANIQGLDLTRMNYCSVPEFE